MKLPVLTFSPSSSDKFIRFWASLYVDKHENHYTCNIGKKLTPECVRILFEWKNGGKASEKKKNTIENFVKKVGEVTKLRNDTKPEKFLEHFDRGGAIWRIFFMHIWHPDRFPIYDQHVYRAMMFIKNRLRREIPAKDQEKIDSYLKDYIPFHKGFQDDNKRSVDKALWTFGKFLKSPFGKTLSIPNEGRMGLHLDL